MQQFGFAAPELERAKRGLLAGYERAFNERNTAESPSLANELVRALPAGRAGARHRLRVPSWPSASCRR